MTRKPLIRDTIYRPRLTVTVQSTGLPLSGFEAYTSEWALKDSAGTVVIDAITGTTDALGHADAEVTAADTADLPAGEYTAEWAISLAGAVEIRHQYILVLTTQVIVAVTP